MTECTQWGFAFEGHFSRHMVAEFSADRLTTKGGALLLREADGKIGLRRRAADSFSDGRQPERVEHRLPEMLAQRIYRLAAGYEDRNDHEQLRSDPLLSGRREIQEPLAGKRTLNRLELTPSGSPLTERYHKTGYSPAAIDALLVKIFLEAHARAETDRAGPGCDRHSATWQAGRALLPSPDRWREDRASRNFKSIPLSSVIKSLSHQRLRQVPPLTSGPN